MTEEFLLQKYIQYDKSINMQLINIYSAAALLKREIYDKRNYAKFKLNKVELDKVELGKVELNFANEIMQFITNLNSVDQSQESPQPTYGPPQPTYIRCIICTTNI